MNKELGFLDQVRITILAEDTIAYDTPFIGRFGLSILLELKAGASEKWVLYDTNSSPAPIIHNLNILGKPLNRIDTIFLSHCHYDHTDGLPGILQALDRPVPVIAHPEIFRPCFEINPDGIRQIGIVGQTRQELEETGAVFTLTRDPLNVMTGVITSGEIERRTSFEILEDLYTLEDGRVVQDHEKDDMALILRLPQGLIIVTGCCHAGIVNTMMQAREITGTEKIHAVIGGLHFQDASKEKIERSIEVLREVDWVLAGHCTGFDGLRRIAESSRDHFRRLQTGITIEFSSSRESPVISTITTARRDRFRFHDNQLPV
ncbi:MAG: MBL fold metallo-hydrolase [Candidatus Auribacterota bacterium]|nr:MBL fold metallo-hydrolase [Candidatus Auribacterota bacterium]